jgi:hypothetical protein
LLLGRLGLPDWFGAGVARFARDETSERANARVVRFSFGGFNEDAQVDPAVEIVAKRVGRSLTMRGMEIVIDSSMEIIVIVVTRII